MNIIKTELFTTFLCLNRKNLYSTPNIRKYLKHILMEDFNFYFHIGAVPKKYFFCKQEFYFWIHFRKKFSDFDDTIVCYTEEYCGIHFIEAKNFLKNAESILNFINYFSFKILFSIEEKPVVIHSIFGHYPEELRSEKYKIFTKFSKNFFARLLANFDLGLDFIFKQISSSDKECIFLMGK